MSGRRYSDRPLIDDDFCEGSPRQAVPPPGYRSAEGAPVVPIPAEAFVNEYRPERNVRDLMEFSSSGGGSGRRNELLDVSSGRGRGSPRPAAPPPDHLYVGGIVIPVPAEVLVHEYQPERNVPDLLQFSSRGGRGSGRHSSGRGSDLMGFSSGGGPRVRPPLVLNECQPERFVNDLVQLSGSGGGSGGGNGWMPVQLRRVGDEVDEQVERIRARVREEAEARRRPRRERPMCPAQEGRMSPSREGRMSPAPAGYWSPAREGRMSPAPAGYWSPAREGSMSMEEQVERIRARVREEAEARRRPRRERPMCPAQEGRMSPSREGRMSPAPAGYWSPAREGGRQSPRAGNLSGSPRRSPPRCQAQEGRMSPAREGRMSPDPPGYWSPAREGSPRRSPRRRLFSGDSPSPPRFQAGEGPMSPAREGEMQSPRADGLQNVMCVPVRLGSPP